MHDVVFRENLAYAILLAVIVIGGGALALHRYRSYWRKLRKAGDPRAKEREMAKQRKRR